MLIIINRKVIYFFFLTHFFKFIAFKIIILHLLIAFGVIILYFLIIVSDIFTFYYFFIFIFNIIKVLKLPLSIFENIHHLMFINL
jgi:hypothetical protein